MAKTKALIITAELICAFVFTYAKIRFSNDAAQIISFYMPSVAIFFLVKLFSHGLACI